MWSCWKDIVLLFSHKLLCFASLAATGLIGSIALQPDNVLYLTTSTVWRLLDMGITATAGAPCDVPLPMSSAHVSEPVHDQHISYVHHSRLLLKQSCPDAFVDLHRHELDRHAATEHIHHLHASLEALSWCNAFDHSPMRKQHTTNLMAFCCRH